MAAETTIEWTHRPGTIGRTWGPTRGCSHAIDPGTGKPDTACAHCYAERNGARQANGGVYTGIIKIGTGGSPRWTGKVEVANNLDQPLRWSKRSTIFVDSMSDLFHESLARGDIASIIGVMAIAPWHDYLILTKRAARMRELMSAFTLNECLDELATRTTVASTGRRVKRALDEYTRRGIDPNVTHWPLPWVWLGVSVGTKTALSRLDDLRATPAVVRFVSFEPLLEDLGELDLRGINWTICGGESGPKSRGCDVTWIRNIIRQSREQGVAPFVKQLGAFPFVGDAGAGWATRLSGSMGTDKHWRWDDPTQPGPLHVYEQRHKKGGNKSEWPEDVRVQEWPL